MLDAGYKLEDPGQAAAAARALDPTRFDEAALKSHAAGEAASVVSAIPEVRAALLRFQQDFAAAPPGAVLDGRDIGTVICPNADAKIFVTATPEVRANRRVLEMRRGGAPADEAEVLADIRRRDERDSARGVAPLKPAADAVMLDTSDLDIEAAFRAADRDRRGRAPPEGAALNGPSERSIRRLTTARPRRMPCETRAYSLYACRVRAAALKAEPPGRAEGATKFAFACGGTPAPGCVATADFSKSYRWLGFVPACRVHPAAAGGHAGPPASSF